MKLNRELFNQKLLPSTLGIFLSILIVVFVIPLPLFQEVDFYDYHVWECEQAHANNMSYSLCSGFWYEPCLEDIENPCVWHPCEDCHTIPHGSILGTGETIMVFGIYGWITTPSYR